MTRRSALTLSRAIPLAACALATSAVAGCSAVDSEPSGTPQPVRHVLVTQADVDALPPADRLRIDLGAARVAYHVALTPTLQPDRILLVSAAGAEAPLTAEIEAIERHALEPLAPTDERLILSGDPSAFEELDAAELAALRAQGELVSEIKASSPRPQPQTEDPCGHARIYLKSELAAGAASVDAWSAHLAPGCEPLCTPGSTEVCYGGPAVTQGVGACQAGVRTCNLTGTAWGSCVGDVRPAPEVCSSTVDLDCNGALGCKPGHLWSQLFGDASEQPRVKSVYDIAADAAGNLLLTGVFSNTLPLGTQTLVSSPHEDVFVVKLDPAGNVLWARSFGSDAERDVASTITTDAAGNVFVGGWFGNTVDFGTGPLVSAGSADIFVLKLDPNGNTIWSKRYGDREAQLADVIAVGPGGEITLTGRWSYSLIDFGLGPVPTTNVASTKTYVVRLDPAGYPLWSSGFDTESVMTPKDLVVDASGDAVVVGWTQGWVNFGGGPVSCAGDRDGFVVRLAASNGATVWGKVLGGPRHDEVRGVALDGAGGAVIAGSFDVAVSLGGGVTLTSAGTVDILLAKLDATDGTALWGKSFGNAVEQSASALELDAAGNIVLLGHYNGALDLGDGVMTSPSDRAISRFIAKLDFSGTLVWSRGHMFETFSRVWGADEERGIAVDTSGNIFFSGYTELAATPGGSQLTPLGPIDYGGGPLTPLGSFDIVVAKYAP